jgi:putative transposase
VEEALIEMYLAGVSVRRVEDITQALWGTRVSLDGERSEPEDLRQIEEWRSSRWWASFRTFSSMACG